MKKYDIILFGATGFTGKRAAKYLNDKNLKSNWAISGRNEAKLLMLKDELDLTQDAIVVDVTKEEDVFPIVQQTKIVISTAGPYDLYGSNLVKACAGLGVHYVDITGESLWVAEMIDKYGAVAEQNKAKIISFCGFDSIPADLGNWMLFKFFNDNWGTTPNISKGYYSLAKGGLNGGTLLSAMNMFENKNQHKLGNPALLLKDQDFNNFIPRVKKNVAVEFVDVIKKWVYPFFMSEINTKVVYRSVALSKKYGISEPEQFYYDEFHALSSKMKARMGLLSLAAFGFFGRYSTMRKLIKKLGPKTGEGPSEDNIENGFFKLEMLAEDNSSNKARFIMKFSGDAGNKATVCFLCESALALLLDHDKLPERYGFLTPTIALDHVLLERLINESVYIHCE